MEKPQCNLPDKERNIFGIMEVVSTTLLNAGQNDQAISFNARAMKCDTRKKVLKLIDEYVVVI